MSSIRRIIIILVQGLVLPLSTPSLLLGLKISGEKRKMLRFSLQSNKKYIQLNKNMQIAPISVSRLRKRFCTKGDLISPSYYARSGGERRCVRTYL